MQGRDSNRNRPKSSEAMNTSGAFILLVACVLSKAQNGKRCKTCLDTLAQCEASGSSESCADNVNECKVVVKTVGRQTIVQRGCAPVDRQPSDCTARNCACYCPIQFGVTSCDLPEGNKCAGRPLPTTGNPTTIAPTTSMASTNPTSATISTESTSAITSTPTSTPTPTFIATSGSHMTTPLTVSILIVLSRLAL